MTRRDHLLHRLQFQHMSIEWLIHSVTADRLIVKPAPDKWSMHDQLTHLAKYQPSFIERIYRILKEDTPLISRYRADEDPEFESWRSWSVQSLIARLMQDRLHMFETIINLSDEQLQRKGTHIKFGTMDILEWIDFFLWHEAHHIFVMYQLAHDSELRT